MFRRGFLTKSVAAIASDKVPNQSDLGIPTEPVVNGVSWDWVKNMWDQIAQSFPSNSANAVYEQNFKSNMDLYVRPEYTEGRRVIDALQELPTNKYDEAITVIFGQEDAVFKRFMENGGEKFKAFCDDFSGNDSEIVDILASFYDGRISVGAWERLYSDLPGHLRHWRTDINHLKFLSHPDVDDALTWLRNAANGKLNIFDDYPDLTPGEVISLNYYTHRGDQINNYYRSGLGSIEPHYGFSDEHVATYSGFLNNALNKLPDYDIPTGSVLYRGTSEYETNLLIGLSSGDDYIPPFYYSTSKNSGVAVARTLALPSPGNLIIEIERGAFKGVDISPFSRYDEEEVLYRINSKFERGGLIPAEYSRNGIFPEVTLTPKL